MPKPRSNLTPKQLEYLGYIERYIELHGRAPAEHEMQAHFRVTPPSVHRMVVVLEEKGAIRRQPGVARSIEVVSRGAPEPGPGRPNPSAARISEPGSAELLRRFREAEYLVRLDDDVAAVFTTEESVNEALRLLLRDRGATPKPVRARTTKRTQAKRRGTSK